MPWRKRYLGQSLSLAAKGLLLVAVPVVAQIGVLLTLRSVQANIAEAERLAIHSKDVLLQTDEVHRLAVQSIASQRAAVITGIADYADAGDPESGEIIRRAEALAQLVADNPPQRQRVEQLIADVRKLEQWIDEQRRLVRDGRAEEAIERIRNEEGRQRLGLLRSELTDLLNEENRLSDERSATLRVESERSGTFVALGALLSLGVACLLAFLFSREISSRFRVLADNAERMAAGEPLPPHLPGSDEIARLDAVLHSTSHRLNTAADAARVARDELERRLHQLNELNEQLRQQTDENETFIYSVSHDLRSPLVNLQGFSKELLMACGELKNVVDDRGSDPQHLRARAAALVDGEIAESVHYIRKAVSRASAIIDSLLRLSRAGRVDYRPQMVHIADVVHIVIDAMRSTINDKHADVRVLPLADAWGDPTAIEQVFANLIGNAVNYLDPERPGRVEIGMVEVAASDPPPLRTYYVRDNGMGIPAAAQNKIFIAFQRYHARHAAGEGVGLALVRRIVERHRGRIWVESQEGTGATFFVELPTGPLPLPPGSADADAGGEPVMGHS